MGTLRCVACQICEKECSPQCIYIEKSKDQKPDAECASLSGQARPAPSSGRPAKIARRAWRGGQKSAAEARVNPEATADPALERLPLVVRDLVTGFFPPALRPWVGALLAVAVIL